jgi:hypothetical protein
MSGLDVRLGTQIHTQSFRMPELRPDVSGTCIYSRQPDGFATLPWPHYAYACDQISGNLARSGDYQPLVAPRQGHFYSFGEARAKLIHELADPTRSGYQDRDQVEIRVVDADGWIRTVRKRGARFDVVVGGPHVMQRSVILKRSGAEDEEQELMRLGTVTFEVPTEHAKLEFVLVSDDQQLDRAQYVPVPSPVLGASSPHVIVEEAAEEEAGAAEVSREMLPQVAEEGTLAQAEQRTEAVQSPSRPLRRGPAKRVLRVVVASPSDVQKERNSLPVVLGELNDGIADYLGLELKLWRWETDAYPGFHADGPQGQIDRIMRIEDADIVIGIFWTRFGTAGVDGRTGTEHELLRAYETWQQRGLPHIMVYFSEQAHKHVDAEQLLALQRFKQRLPKEGLWWSYAGASKFADVVRKHLTRLLLDHYGGGE